MSERRPHLTWNRRAALAGAAGLLAPAWPAPAQPPGGAPAAPDPGEILRERKDSTARLTTEVMVQGQGPFRFVIDTGASRSVISDQLAARLQLPAGPPTLVHGLAGAEPAPTALVDRMEAGAIDIPVRHVPVLRSVDLGCDGLLGLDAFHGREVVFDFTNQVVRIQRANFSNLGQRPPPSPLSEAVVHARQRFGQLMIVDAEAARRRVSCFIDSGAQLSVGNRALLRAVRRRLGDRAGPELTTTVHSATGDDIVCDVAWIDSLRIGTIYFTRFLMAFADLHTFELWAVKDQPALMIGMDFMNLFGRVEIDFGENEVRFRRGKPR